VGSSGDWDAPANWSTGALPGTNDDVVIGAGPAITVTHATGNDSVRSVRSQQAFSLSGGSLTVAATFQSSNTFTFAGGVFHQGTITLQNNASLVVAGSGALDGVTVNGVLDVGNSVNGAYLLVTNGLVLNGTALVGNPTNGWGGAIDFLYNQTVSGTGTLLFGNCTTNALLFGANGASITLGPGITVRGQNGQLNWDPSVFFFGAPVTVLSQGSIAADGNGVIVVQDPVKLSNSGQVSVLRGSTLKFNGSFTNSQTVTLFPGALLQLSYNGSPWANLGSINGTNAILNIRGSAAPLGTLALPGCTVELAAAFTGPQVTALQQAQAAVQVFGSVDNTGNALVLDTNVGLLTLSGGIIQGGTLNSSNSIALVCSNGANMHGVTVNGTVIAAGNPSPGLRAYGMTINGTLDVGNRFNFADLEVANGFTLNGTALLGNPTNGWGGQIGFLGNQTLSGTGSIVFGNGTINWLVFPSGSALTIGPGITVHGKQGLFTGGSPAVVTNQGSLIADGGGTIKTELVTLINQGVMGAGPVGLLDVETLSGNLGQVALQPGGALKLNGTYTNNLGVTLSTNTVLTLNGTWANVGGIAATGATVNLNGTWANLGGITGTNASVNLNGTLTPLGTFELPGSTLSLGINLTPAQLLGLLGPQVTVQLAAQLDNTGNTLTLDATTGSLVLNGGTLLGGTVNCTDGTSLVCLDAVLDGVTVNGTLDVGNSYDGGYAEVLDGLVLNGTAWIGNPTNEWTGEIDFYGDQTVSGSGTIIFGHEPYQDNLIYLAYQTTLTLGPGITLRGENGTLEGRGVISQLLNLGTLAADVPGGTWYGYGQSTYLGNVKIAAGATLDYSDNLIFNGYASLQTQPGATLALEGGVSLLGDTRNADAYLPQGTLEFYSGAHLLEAMSADQGNVSSGFADNFAYGTLLLDAGSQVTLVDQHTNSSGGTAEAVYVNSLIVSTGAVLNLNGLHLYARVSQVDGTITSGSVSQIQDHTIAPDSTVASLLPSPGAAEAWTFFGRAGDLVTVSVDTGSANLPNPHLAYGEVRLLDPLTNILAEASSTAADQTLALTRVQLPADGVYRIQVSAAASFGSYQLTLWDVTPNVQTLSLNRPANGFIAVPYGADQWNFAAVAGQQIQFSLLNVSAPGLGFDLTGPNGWSGFTNLAASSGLMTLPFSGNYTLTPHGSASAYGINYAFEVLQAASVLAPNFRGNLSASDQSQLFTLVVTNSGPLSVILNTLCAGNSTELYIQRGSPPTRGMDDFRSTNPNALDQQIVIPAATPGTYYLLVYGQAIFTPCDFTLQTSTAAFSVLTQVTPDSGGNTIPTVLTLSGAGFGPACAVALIATNGTHFSAPTVQVDSPAQITAAFAANTLPAGLYSVVVSQPGGDAGLTNVFTVVPPGTAHLETRLIMPAALGRHAVATLYLEYANTGSAAMRAPLLELVCTGPSPAVRPILTLDASRIIQNYWSAGLPPGTANQILLLGSGAQPGVLNPGESLQVPVYYLGLQQPWDFTQNSVQMKIRYWTAEDTTPIDWASRQESLRPTSLDSNIWSVIYSSLTSPLTSSGAYVRLLDDNAQYLNQLGEPVSDANLLWTFAEMQADGLAAFPVLDSAVDAALPSPGVALNFTRQFSSTLRARNSRGLFGFGWFTLWAQTLQVQDGGSLVELVGEAGSARAFTLDSRSGNYFSQSGDSSQLSLIGPGIYELRDPDGASTRFRSDGRMDYLQDPDGNRVTASYNSSGQLVTLTHTSGAGLSLSYNGAGLISQVNDSAGRSLTYAYDADKAYLQTVTSDDGKVTAYSYLTTGTAAQQHALASVSRGGVTRSFTYDTSGRLLSTYLGSGDQLLTFGYGPAGTVTRTDAHGASVLSFDYHGQLARVADALGNITTARYNQDLRLAEIVAPTGESQNYTWCGCGSLSSITDELGNTVALARNNPLNRPTSFTDARNNTTSFNYDTNGNMLSIAYPDSSRETFGSYTAAGLAQTHVNRRGQSVSYGYTALGQVATRTFPDGSYDAFSYDPRGNLLSITNYAASGTNQVTSYAYSYATDGDRLRQITYPNGRWVAFGYDGFGRRQQLSDSTGQTNYYAYDAAGRLWRLLDGGGLVLAEYLYDAAGLLQRVNKANGSYVTCVYDAKGQPLHLVNYAANATVNSRFDYTYDSRARRSTLTTLDGVWTYTYDSVGQLVHASLLSSNLAIPNQDLRFAYDAAGNRTTAVINGSATNYSANSLGEYAAVGQATFAYDADGNLISDGVHSYTYDIRNRLVRVTGSEGTTQYEYDALDHRTATVFNGQRTEFLVDPAGLANAVAEYDGAGNLLAHNAFALGLVSRAAGGGLAYYDFDALGNAAGLSDGAGNYLGGYAYAPFGETLHSPGALANPFAFGAQDGLTTDPDSLLFMRARAYAPGLGRFASVDPLWLRGGGVQQYTFAQNNPVLFKDPSGMACWKCEWVNGGPDKFFGFSSGVSSGFSAGVSGSAGVGVGIGVGLTQTGPIGVDVGPTAGLSAGVFDGVSVGTGIGYSHGSTTGFICGWGWGEGCDDNNKKTPPPPDPDNPGGPGGGNGGGGGSGTANSFDPNDLIGPSGYTLANYLVPAVFAYEIIFQNQTNATAPAQSVQVTDPLSTNLNWQTFALTEIAFGDQFIPMPPGAQYFETNLPLTLNGLAVEIQIEAGIDFARGQVFASFFTIDPTTGLPPEVNLGFLPPEDGTGRGTGHLSYLISPRANVPTGTQITNIASIRFDENPVITTDQLDPLDPSKGIDTNRLALVTIDNSPPSSAVTPLPRVLTNTNFMVCWSGSDVGSGIVAYDVYVATNSAPWGLWLAATTNTCAVFQGQMAHSYGFYSVAYDGAGNVQSTTANPNAVTILAPHLPPQFSPVPNRFVAVGQRLLVTNLVQDPDLPLTFSLDPSAPAGASVSTNGVFSWTPSCAQASTTNLITVWATDSYTIPLSNSVSFIVSVSECLQVSVGSTVMQVGTTSSVPISVISTLDLTNLNLTLAYPTNRFANWVFSVSNNAIVKTFVQTMDPSQTVFNLAANSGSTFNGPSILGSVSFEALPGSSAFVPLSPVDIAGSKIDGNLVGNSSGQWGRVVVIGAEPLVEGWMGSNSSRMLTVYGNPGTNYQSMFTTNLLSTNWSLGWSALQTNLFQYFRVEQAAPQIFFRARQ
jgi:RHS repeat-associated protein